MINYTEILSTVRKKLDAMMEAVNPEEPLEPDGISKNGRYTANLSSFYRPGWTYSFYLGMIALMYLHTKEERYIDYLRGAKKTYTFFLWGNREELGHDCGFLYSLYAVAMYKLTGEEEYKALALKAADELGKRYQFEARHMQAFYDMRIRGITDETSQLIADDMMNMCLLIWAYRETGHSFYRSVFTNHIETAVHYLIRGDYSVRHAYHFDVRTGRPLGEANICGYAVGSHWARGTAWMIYGLTKALQYSGSSERYLSPLEGVSEKYLRLTEQTAVPVWDFRLPKEEYRAQDSSAAAICASAFAEFGKIGVNERLAKKAAASADRAIGELCSKHLALPDAECILKYRGSEGCLWGDYFFTELLMKKAYGDRLIDFWI